MTPGTPTTAPVFINGGHSSSSSDEGMMHEEFSFSPSPVFSKLSDSDIVYAKKEPKLVGSYLFGEALGKGAYAKVKEAVNIQTRQKVAVKVINKKQLRKIPNGEENVRTEIEVHEKLDHPNIVKFIEAFTLPEKNKLYIILEHIGGGTIQDLLDDAPNNRLPLSQARCYFRQLIEAMEYLQKVGVVHRDIKPGNMLLTVDGTMKLADFGVAQWASKVDPKTGTQGSPAFQPPEVASGMQRAAGLVGDIWAMGVLLYFITVGHLPFQGQTVYTLFEAIARGDFTFPEWLTDNSLRDLISRILQVDPNDRLSLEEIKNHPWVALTSPESVLPSMSNVSDSTSSPSCSSSSTTGEDWIPLKVATSLFTEDPSGLVILPALPSASGQIQPPAKFYNPTTVPSLPKNRPYKERCCLVS